MYVKCVFFMHVCHEPKLESFSRRETCTSQHICSLYTTCKQSCFTHAVQSHRCHRKKTFSPSNLQQKTINLSKLPRISKTLSKEANIQIKNLFRKCHYPRKKKDQKMWVNWWVNARCPRCAHPPLPPKPEPAQMATPHCRFLFSALSSFPRRSAKLVPPPAPPQYILRPTDLLTTHAELFLSSTHPHRFFRAEQHVFPLSRTWPAEFSAN